MKVNLLELFDKLIAGKEFRKEEKDVFYSTVEDMGGRRGREKMKHLRQILIQPEFSRENNVLPQKKHMENSNFRRVSFARRWQRKTKQIE